MKICFVSPGAYVFFNPNSTHLVGGAEKQMFMIGQYLANVVSHQVLFCVADFGQPKVETFGSVTTIKTFAYGRSKIVGFLKLLRAFRDVNADVYMFRGADVGVAMSILSLKFFCPKKKLFYMLAHTDELKDVTLSKLLGSIPAMLMSFCYRFVDLITVQAEDHAKQFFENRKFKVDAVVRNMVKIPEIVAADKSSVLWVGRSVEWKRPDFFLDMAETHEFLNFVMICPYNFDDNCYQRVKNRAARIKNLIFIESVAPDRIGEYFANARLYVITSEAEGFPNTMLEAFSYGVPVLSLGIDPDNVIERYRMGTVVHSLEQMNNSLLQMMDSSTLLGDMSVNAIGYVKQYHSEEAVGEAIRCLLESL